MKNDSRIERPLISPRVLTALGVFLLLLLFGLLTHGRHLPFLSSFILHSPYYLPVAHGLFASGMILIVMGMLLWNSFMHETIRKKTESIYRELAHHDNVQADLREARNLAEMILDTSPNGIFIYDIVSHGIIYINSRMSSLTGWPIEELMSKGGQILDLVHPDDRARISDYLTKRLRKSDSTISGVECRFRKADGEWIDFHIMETVFSSQPDGTPERIIGTAIDMTSQRRAWEVIAESEQNLRITLDSIGDAVISTNAAGIVVRSNPVARRLLANNNEIIGLQIRELVSFLDALTRTRQTLPIDDMVNRLPGADESIEKESILLTSIGERLVSWHLAPMRPQGKRFIGFVLVMRDITDQYQLEEQLHHVQKMDSIGQLAGGIAHDFNNLLAGIIGSTELLGIRIPEGDVNHQFLSLILNAANRAAELTKQLLVFSRKNEVNWAPLNINTCIDDAISILGHTIDKRISISVNASDSVPSIVGDAGQIQNAILNIAINARDAMPDGGLLKFSSRLEEINDENASARSLEAGPGSYVVLEIKDTGIGMTPEIMNRIFEPFFTTKGVGQGTGLGLSAVYGTVRTHGGGVQVESRPGEGTLFRLFFPVHFSSHSDGIVFDKKESVPAVFNLPKGVGTILFVDDESVVRLAAARLLEDVGYTVLEAGDGPEALEIFRQNHDTIDLVMLDIMMPLMNGKEVFFQMMDIDKTVPVIVISGYSASGEPRALIEAGARAFVQKPFMRTHLYAEVARHLKKRPDAPLRAD